MPESRASPLANDATGMPANRLMGAVWVRDREMKRSLDHTEIPGWVWGAQGQAKTVLHHRLVDTLCLKTLGRFYNHAELVAQRRRWRMEGKTVVFTNGCYDLLHPGHIRTLEAARSMGDVLILALNSDAGTRRIKGPSRPIVGEQKRIELALALDAVDAVTLFDEETPRALVAAVLPDVLVKGADWSHFVAGRAEVEAAGGKVVTLPLELDYSTTNIVKLIAAGHRS